jgi:hypothetical protein
MGRTFVALNSDGQPRMYGYARGAGHVVLIPVDAMNDPLATGGVLETPCGGKGVDSERLTEKFTGDKMCTRCVAWLDSDGGRNDVEAAREAKWDRENTGPSLAEIMGDHILITLDGAREVKGPDAREESAPEPVREITREEVRDLIGRSKRGAAVRKREAAVERERERLAAQRKAREARDAAAEAREESAQESEPVQGELWGKTHAEMRAAVATFYASGKPVPAEVAALPDPAVVQVQWSGTNGAGDTDWRGCEGAGPVAVVNAERTHGKCPACNAYIELTDTEGEEDFRIGSHYEYGVAAPANPHMSSQSLDAVEHGTVPGSPVIANKRRKVEALCKRSDKVARGVTQGGAKQCPECARSVELYRRERTVKGKAKVQWVYPEHVDSRDTFGRSGADGKGERKVTPRGSGADAGKGARDHGSVNGSANTGAHNLPPVQPKSGWLAVAGTSVLSATVRPGVDPVVQGEWCPLCKGPKNIVHRGKSRGWRRDHSKKMAAWHKEQDAKRAVKRERDTQQGKRLPQGARKAARQAASVGSFAEGTVAGVVMRGTRPEDTPAGTPVGKRTRQVSKRTPAPGEAEAVKGGKRK